MNHLKSLYSKDFYRYTTYKYTSKVMLGGMMENPKTCTKGYRYGFNGQEKDNEVSGEGNSYTAEFWEYDARLARRWNVDPAFMEKPWISPYHAFSNKPIINIDPNGANDGWYEGDDNEMHFDKDVHSQADLKEKGVSGTYKFEEGQLNKASGIDKGTENYYADGSAFFTNETRGYNFMWNTSFQGNKTIENTGFLTDQGVMVNPTEGVTSKGKSFQNDSRTGENDVYPSKRGKDGLVVNFHGKTYSATASIHTHPDSDIIPYHSGPDVLVMRAQKMPMFVIHKNQVYVMTPSSTGPYSIGRTRNYLQGTQKITPYINKF